MTRRRTRPAAVRPKEAAAPIVAAFDQRSPAARVIPGPKGRAGQPTRRNHTLLAEAIKRRSKSRPTPKP